MLVVGAAVPCAMGALPAAAESLTDALIETYSSNPQLEAERAQLRATDETVPQALAGWRPTVQVNGSGGAEATQNSPAQPPLSPAYSAYTAWNVDLSVSQPVYQSGRTVAQTAQAEDTVRAERAHAVAVESAVLLASVQAYLDVLRDQAVVEANRDNEAVLRGLLDATKKRAQIGELNATDLAEATTHYNAAMAARQSAEGTLAADRVNYRRAVGHLPGVLSPVSVHPALPKAPEQALQLAVNNNPNVIAAVFTENAARDAVLATRAQLGPNVNVVGDVNRSPNASLNGLQTTTESLVLRVTLPLYEAGTVYSQTRQAIETVGQRRDQIDDARRAALQGAGQALEAIQATRDTIVTLNETLRTSKIAVEDLRKEISVGARAVFEALIAQQDQFGYRVTLAQNQHDLAVAEWNLAQQIGSLTAADLKLPVALYDVDKHYREVRDKWWGIGDLPSPLK
jgi:TolC family type I secretion outer membrane protein